MKALLPFVILAAGGLGLFALYRHLSKAGARGGSAADAASPLGGVGSIPGVPTGSYATANGTNSSLGWLNKCAPQQDACVARGGQWVGFPQDPGWDGHSVPGTCGSCRLPDPSVQARADCQNQGGTFVSGSGGSVGTCELPHSVAPAAAAAAYGSCPDRQSCAGEPTAAYAPVPPAAAPRPTVNVIGGPRAFGIPGLGGGGALFHV